MTEAPNESSAPNDHTEHKDIMPNTQEALREIFDRAGDDQDEALKEYGDRFGDGSIEEADTNIAEKIAVLLQKINRFAKRNDLNLNSDKASFMIPEDFSELLKISEIVKKDEGNVAISNSEYSDSELDPMSVIDSFDAVFKQMPSTQLEIPQWLETLIPEYAKESLKTSRAGQMLLMLLLIRILEELPQKSSHIELAQRVDSETTAVVKRVAEELEERESTINAWLDEYREENQANLSDVDMRYEPGIDAITIRIEAMNEMETAGIHIIDLSRLSGESLKEQIYIRLDEILSERDQ